MRNDSIFEINLKLLDYNFSLLKEIAPNNEIIFMVKANAYGHGICEIVEYCFTKLGIHLFGCASLGEALYLKQNFPNTELKIIVFSETNIENESLNSNYVNSQIIPVIHSLSQLNFVLKSDTLSGIPLYLKFNTGMNRLGILKEEVTKVKELLIAHKRTKIDHLLTHFSQSYFKLKDEDKTHLQYKKFKQIKESFFSSHIEITETSVSNSGAIEQSFGLEESHIRPGLMLYGPKSLGTFKQSETLWHGKSISSLSSKVLKLEAIKKGTPIGYGGHPVHEDGIIAYLPMGYGDGILTYYTGAKIKHNEVIGQIIGRVNMDMVAIFFKKSDLSQIKVNDVIYFWKQDEESIVDFSNQVKTIPYQVYTAITNRVPKVYYS